MIFPHKKFIRRRMFLKHPMSFHPDQFRKIRNVEEMTREIYLFKIENK